MIIDTVENLSAYASLNPLFPKAIAYLQSTDLLALEPGKIVLEEGKLIVNVNQVPPKAKEAALLETHIEFIDIQLPLSGEETMGYTPAKELPETTYDADNDIAFYPGLASQYVTLKLGMFAIFLPTDGHAPGITPTGVKKIIVKVKV
ncbi:MAG: YhcH/YjgK/YiaL family protein [Bacteroidaceae bacterium]|nr:YhcH/YjgK/YiaL family protein [Bacteroidaceae bacterium]